MPDQPPTDDISGRSFRTVFRGYDPAEVAAFLSELAAEITELRSQRDRLAARLGELGARDLRAEFEAVGREVAEVLEAARSAAETIRERAAADAARWRSEALAEAEAERRSARADAEQLRSDAWTTSSQLLEQVQREAEALRTRAERDALTILGEAEREAHRLTAAARREADETLRSARMEAERLNVEANARHDEIIETARRQAEAAQERARALEQRRDELLRELESVKATLTRMEGELDQRREHLGLSAAPPEPSVRVVPGPAPRPSPSIVTPEDGEDWEPGETVRVIRPGPRTPHDEEEQLPEAEELAEEVARLQRPQSPGEAASPPDVEPGNEALQAEPPTSPEPAPAPQPPAPVQAVEEPAGPAPPTEEAPEEAPPPPPAPPRQDEVEDLFRRLRGPAVRGAPTPESPSVPRQERAPAASAALREEPPPAPPPRARPAPSDPAAFDRRERLLLPVTNRALRNIKRQLTEEQNLALDEIRSAEEKWEPQGPAITERVRADLVVLVSEAYAAGHAAAEELVGERLPRPPAPQREVADGFVAALVDDLREVVEEARNSGQGGRQLSASVSRVFRGWRTDEAERRVRDLAHRAYHEGLAAGLGHGGRRVRFLVGGRGCATCRAAEEEGDRLPPIHPGCSCTLAAG